MNRINILFLIAITHAAALIGQTQIGYDIIPGNPQHEEQFGFRSKLSADGNTAAVSAPIFQSALGAAVGRVVIYEYNNNNWVQKGNVIEGSFIVSGFGLALDMTPDGNTIVGGAPLFPPAPPNPRRGQVRVFDFNGFIWVQRGQSIEGLSSGDRFGGSVSISADGNTIVSGATQHDGNGVNQSGEAKAYQWNANTNMWVLLGNPIYGNANDYLGISTEISQDGTRFAIGAQFGDVGGSQNGYVKVYDFDGVDWVQLGNTIEGEEVNEEFGFRLDFNEDATILAVTARFSGDNDGSARVFELNDGTNIWEQKGSTLTGTISKEFGTSIDISDNGIVLAIGAQNSDNGEDDGRATMYQFDNGDWVEIGIPITNPVGGVVVQTGNSVSLDALGNTLIVGSGFFPSSPGINSGKAQVFDLSDVMIVNVDDLNTDTIFSIYPNPVKELVFIYSKSNTEIANVAVYNILGELLLTKDLNKGYLDMSTYKTGIYFISITTGDRIVSTILLKE